MYKQTVTLSFQTDRELTDYELNEIIDAIALQITDPTDENNEASDFSTHSITVRIDRN